MSKINIRMTQYSIKGNSAILSGIAGVRYVVQAICVKLLLADPLMAGSGKSKWEGASNDNCLVCTFRIYPTTKFPEIKRAACEFWNKIEQRYNLTDEYFNNLQSFTGETVMNFYKNYAPLNSHNEAVVYLIPSNQKIKELHRLQYEGIAMDDKKGDAGKGGKGNEAD